MQKPRNKVGLKVLTNGEEVQGEKTTRNFMLSDTQTRKREEEERKHGDKNWWPYSLEGKPPTANW